MKHRIPFNRRSDGHCTTPPRLLVYRPQLGFREWLTTTRGAPLDEAAPLWELQTQLDLAVRTFKNGRTGQLQDHLQRVSALLNDVLSERPAPLSAFEIGQTAAQRRLA